MAGLVGYASSDDEDDSQQASPPQLSAPHTAPRERERPATGGAHAPPRHEDVVVLREAPPAPAADPDAMSDAAPASVPRADILIGPARPPQGSDSALAELPDDEDSDSQQRSEAGALSPLSPRAAERALRRALTLPRVPDFAIPGSPPPPAEDDKAALAALDRKFAHFLALKRGRATHFNARLAQSAALKNPAVTDKLLAFVGLGLGDDPTPDAIAAQYATVLPVALWNPGPHAAAAPAFPPWAYRHSLRKVQDDLAKQRARAAGERVEFVAASNAASAAAAGSRTGIATGKRKSRFD